VSRVTAPRVNVRAATAADHAAWLPLWQAYLAFYKTELPDATTKTTWTRLLDQAEPVHLALAELDGRVVGLVHFIEHRSCWSPLNSVYLQDLFTDATVRGRGVGRALIEHVYAQASMLGAGKVHWLTHETNAQAMALYDQLAERPGFVQYRKSL
jgi:GNAT superfamily N-acetyltransferase